MFVTTILSALAAGITTTACYFGGSEAVDYLKDSRNHGKFIKSLKDEPAWKVIATMTLLATKDDPTDREKVEIFVAFHRAFDLAGCEKLTYGQWYARGFEQLHNREESRPYRDAENLIPDQKTRNAVDQATKKKKKTQVPPSVSIYKGDEDRRRGGTVEEQMSAAMSEAFSGLSNSADMMQLLEEVAKGDLTKSELQRRAKALVGEPEPVGVSSSD